MKTKSAIRLLLGVATACALSQCNTPSSDAAAADSGDSAPVAGQSAVADDVSQKDVVKVAVGSPAHTTLVAVTGWGQDTDRQLAREAGFDEYMVKPVEMERVQAVLRSG